MKKECYFVIIDDTVIDINKILYFVTNFCKDDYFIDFHFINSNKVLHINFSTLDELYECRQEIIENML